MLCIKSNLSHLLALLLLTALIATQDAAPTAEGDAVADNEEETHKLLCPKSCPPERNNVCGYEGNCYRIYLNQCTYDADKCNKRTSLETVDPSLCDLAGKDTHPNYKICPND